MPVKVYKLFLSQAEKDVSSVNICYFKMLINSQNEGLGKVMVCRSSTYHEEKLMIFSIHFVVDI